MLPVNDPPPVPFKVLVASATVGLVDVLQQTPLAVTPEIQLPDTFPPDDAVEDVIEEIAVVVTVGSAVAAVNETSFP
jgi:hypothetical protein